MNEDLAALAYWSGAHTISAARALSALRRDSNRHRHAATSAARAASEGTLLGLLYRHAHNAADAGVSTQLVRHSIVEGWIR